ncbi:MAG TPA: hypothetical protein VFV74_05825 [Burkholderiales bacterium]|nr:hypothetical protein [Burkholderiales bacterium]
MSELMQMVRSAGPYLAIELLLPGGSVIALALWIFRHRSAKWGIAASWKELRRLGNQRNRA